MLPPRHLPAHALVERQLLAHAGRVTSICAQESMSVCATLDDLGAVLLWQLSPLQPLQQLESRPGSSKHTAATWLQTAPDSDDRSSSGPAESSLLAAASSEFISIISVQRCAFRPYYRLA